MEQQKPFLEVVDKERELLALIYAKRGDLDDDVLKLHRRIRTEYEDIMLKNDEETVQYYQEIEYNLWKLHYKLIHEFRRTIIIRQRNDAVSSSDGGASNSSGEDAADHRKTQERYSSFLSESANFYTNLIVKLRKKFGFPPVIFLGKDSSYGGFVSAVEKGKSDACQYSCHRLLVCLGDLVRYGESCKKSGDSDWSAAAKYYLEAAKIWPDSGNPHNQLALLARHIDDPFLALYHLVRSLFVKDPFPDAWRNILLLFDESISTDSTSASRQHTPFDFLNPSPKPCNEEKRWEELELWPVLVRAMSFFFIKSSFEEFPSTFVSTVCSLEALLESGDDTNLLASLESYQLLDSSKKGPHRALHIVSISIFVFHNVTEKLETNEKQKHDPVRKPFAISAIFVSMGRLIERCCKRNRKNSCPLLPAVSVFLEWLLEKLDVFDVEDDERVASSLSYLLVSLSRLLQRMDRTCNEMAFDMDDNTALWEDHELRGFLPLARIHEKLDFKTDPGFSRDSNPVRRRRRVFLAASTILERSGSYRKAILDQDELLNSAKALHLMDDRVQDAPNQETEPNSEPKAQQLAEEEIIVFKPITRRNSAPIKETGPAVPDESLRRAASLYAEGQQRAVIADSSFSFPGPPSLSAWVPPAQGGPKARDKQKLSPIEETPSSQLPRSLPIPSAPLLPEEPLWLRGDPVISSSDYYGRWGVGGNEGDGILGAPPGPGIPSLIDNYYIPLPPIVGMSSSEWLHHYRNGHNYVTMNHDAGARGLGNYYSHRYLGSPLIYSNSSYVYGGDRLEYSGLDKGFLDYDELSSSMQPTPLLQYLKERERQLQQSTGTQFKKL